MPLSKITISARKLLLFIFIVVVESTYIVLWLMKNNHASCSGEAKITKFGFMSEKLKGRRQKGNLHYYGLQL